MENISIISRILGSLFYYPLTHSNNQEIISTLAQEPEFEGTGFDQLRVLVQQQSKEVLTQDFLHLFEGAGVMPVPPWGSVYLDKEEVIFGDSALAYRVFLSENGIQLNTGVREPEDQFGLMLMAISRLAESGQSEDAIKTLLGEHLLTWAYRYLELVSEHAQTDVYKLLSQLAYQWCNELQETLAVTPTRKQIYR